MAKNHPSLNRRGFGPSCEWITMMLLIAPSNFLYYARSSRLIARYEKAIFPNYRVINKTY